MTGRPVTIFVITQENLHENKGIIKESKVKRLTEIPRNI